MKLLEQPTDKTCCQTVVAMLAGVTPEQVIKEMKHSGKTVVSELRIMLNYYGWHSGTYSRIKVKNPITKDIWPWQNQLTAHTDILKIRYRNKDGSLSKAWHASLYYNNQVYDPAYGMNPWEQYKYKDIAVVTAFIPVWPELGN